MKKTASTFSPTHNAKPIIIVGVAILLVIALLTTFFLLKKEEKQPVPEEYITVTLDLDNSCIIYTLNPEDYSVKSISTLSDTDKYLVSDMTVNIPFSLSSKLLIDKLMSNNKIKNTGDEYLLFAVESLDPADFNSLAEAFRLSMGEKDCKSSLHTLYIKVKEASIIESAEQKNVSYAKAYLCKNLAQNTSSDFDSLVSSTISEIISTTNAEKDSPDATSSIVSNLNNEQVKEPVPEKPSTSSSNPSSSNPSSSTPSTETPSTSTPSTETPSTSTPSTSTPSTSTPSTSTPSTNSSYSVESGNDGFEPGYW